MKITTRHSKGSALTFTELDANFTFLDQKGGLLRGAWRVGPYNLLDQVIYAQSLYYRSSPLPAEQEKVFDADKWQLVPAPSPGPEPAPVTTVFTHPFTSQSNLTISHNLGRYVLVEVYTADGQQVAGDVRYVDPNTVNLTFSQPLTGTVVLR